LWTESQGFILKRLRRLEKCEIRAGLGPEKTKGGVESPPFALLPNGFYIKKQKDCKGKSGSESVSDNAGITSDLPVTRE